MKKGLNVICLCRYAEIEDWLTKYRRVSIKVKIEGQVMFLEQTPDLDIRWQALILTDSLPLCLKDMIAMRLGFQCMRREKAVVLARLEESIDHVLTVNRELLDSWKLSSAQKVLLHFNSSMTRNKSCPLLTKRSNGHDGVAMSKDILLYRAFDWEFSMDYAASKEWFRKQWMTIMVDPYWDATDISVPLFDFHDWYEYPFWYSWNQDKYNTEPDRYLGWDTCMSRSYWEYSSGMLD